MDTKQQHLKIKKHLNTEIQAWVKKVLTINAPNNETFEDFSKNLDMSTPRRKGEVKFNYLNWLRKNNLVPEELEQKTFTFPDGKEYLVQLSVVIENPDAFVRKFGTGTHPNVVTSPSTNTYSMNYNCRNMQGVVVEAREIMQTDLKELEDYPDRKETVIKKQKALKSAYKKAHPSDPIRRCWKWITNPNNTEGVHTPYTEPPTAKFTQYDNKNEKPVWIKIRKQAKTTAQSVINPVHDKLIASFVI